MLNCEIWLVGKALPHVASNCKKSTLLSSYFVVSSKNDLIAKNTNKHIYAGSTLLKLILITY